jgi:hypothetical protein
MLEQSLRELFGQQAEVQPPPGRVTVADVIRQGRLRRRRRRIGAICTPALAASAALAVALSGVLPTAILGLGRRHPASSAGAVPREFNPAQVYAKFGWLPARTHLAYGDNSPLMQILGYAGPHMKLPNEELGLTVQARGTCHSRRYPGVVFSLICSPGSRTDATSRAPDINGHRAFWAGNRTGLIWQYGTNAWAVLGFGTAMPAATRLRIAAGIKFGQHAPIKFASRLTSGHWQVAVVHFQPDQGVDLADQYIVAKNGSVSDAYLDGADSSAPGLGQIMTTPQTSGEHCNIPKSWPKKHLTIHGYKFTLTTVKGTAWQLLCGQNEDGLFVKMYENGSHPPVTLTGIMEHLQLLGTKPAHWVTNPLP